MKTAQEILELAITKQLYTALINQLNKDFTRVGLEAGFEQNLNAEALIRNLTATIYELIVSDFESYLNVLYAIDVSEFKIKDLPVQQVHELAIAVTQLIIEREFVKVSFKSKLE
ncbi:hypothetical protein [Leeuwenhoekiella sp. NPDC079379]|uniref:hypothetical protein n=1 Tax=Leeuwenhoekiella sp. NPDC079379 TaxID=3364122 RepID=UPI0037C5C352